MSKNTYSDSQLQAHAGFDRFYSLKNEDAPQREDSADADMIDALQVNTEHPTSNGRTSMSLRLENALKRSIAACLAADQRIPPVYPQRHYFYCLEEQQVDVLMKLAALMGRNRLGKTLTAEEIESMHIDHVISLPELDVTNKDQVQLWRSISMWDPMAKEDNLSKGDGNHRACFRQEAAAPPEIYYVHSSTRKLERQKDITDLRVKWDWVQNRERLFQTYRLKKHRECICGVCRSVDGIDSLDETGKREVDEYLLRMLYHEILFLNKDNFGLKGQTMTEILRVIEKLPNIASGDVNFNMKSWIDRLYSEKVLSSYPSTERHFTPTDVDLKESLKELIDAKLLCGRMNLEDTAFLKELLPTEYHARAEKSVDRKDQVDLETVMVYLEKNELNDHLRRYLRTIFNSSGFCDKKML